MEVLTSAAVVERLVARLYGQPVIRNDLRGELVEEIVGIALEAEWRLCGSDWAAHDLEHRRSGLKMQVRQSAARQTWSGQASRTFAPRFLIATKTGRYEDGTTWISEPSRNADVFVFAWHGLNEGADHRDPQQWTFYPVLEAALPDAASISLRSVQALSRACQFGGLADAVQDLITSYNNRI